MEVVKTYVIGTNNVLTAAIEAGSHLLKHRQRGIPIMGITKAIEEKIAVAKSRYSLWGQRHRYMPQYFMQRH